MQKQTFIHITQALAAGLCESIRGDQVVAAHLDSRRFLAGGLGEIRLQIAQGGIARIGDVPIDEFGDPRITDVRATRDFLPITLVLIE